MSRRSFPRIDPDALRDHADEARVERVWERVEHDLASRLDRLDTSRSPRRAAAAFVYMAAAATFAAFGGGLLIGKATWDKRAENSAAIVTPIIEKSLVDVLAAGTQPRTFPLQGGGRLTLLPGAVLEVERSGSTLTLSLLQGAASVDAMGRALAMVVGDTRINTQAGGVFSVTRNASDLDVNVTDGLVNVSSPAGSRQLGKDERAEAVPIHTEVSSAPVNAAPRRIPALLPQRRPSTQNPNAAKLAGVPEWFTHYLADEERALLLLRKQGVNQAIDTARSAAWLMAIADIMRGKGRDQIAEIRSLDRLIQSFPSDQRASLAAGRLAQIYEARGEPARAKEYKDRVKPLAQSATTGADSLVCDVIRHEPDKNKAALLAKEYLDKYPDGECRDEFERVVAGDTLNPPSPQVPAGTPVTPDPAPAPATP
jgi:hypothetical protein